MRKIAHAPIRSEALMLTTAPSDPIHDVNTINLLHYIFRAAQQRHDFLSVQDVDRI